MVNAEKFDSEFSNFCAQVQLNYKVIYTINTYEKALISEVVFTGAEKQNYTNENRTSGI